MSAGKGSSPRNCFSARFRENYDAIFAKKHPDAEITTEIHRILREEEDSEKSRSKLAELSLARASRRPARKSLERTVDPHPITPLSSR